MSVHELAITVALAAAFAAAAARTAARTWIEWSGAGEVETALAVAAAFAPHCAPGLTPAPGCAAVPFAAAARFVCSPAADSPFYAGWTLTVDGGQATARVEDPTARQLAALRRGGYVTAMESGGGGITAVEAALPADRAGRDQSVQMAWYQPDDASLMAALPPTCG